MKFKKIIKLIVVFGAAALTLAGCASSSTTFGPDGQQAFTLNCSGLARTWGACLEKAGDLCGTRGYEVLSSNGESGAIIGGSSSGFAGGSTISRSMLIQCKRPS